MKDIDLVKLKELAARLLNPTDRFSEVSDKFEWKAVASPAVISELIEQLEAAQRMESYWKTQFRSATEHSEKLEAEIKRRDAQEAVGWQFKSVNGVWLGLIGEDGKNQAIKEGCEVRPVYAAVPAVVLPPEIQRDDTDGYWLYKGGRVGGGAAEWYNQAIADAKALGCQPQKVVKLPETYQTSCSVDDIWYAPSDIKQALDEAGVKWE